MQAVNPVAVTQPWVRPLTDEAANCVTHGAGLVLSVYALAKLFLAADGRGTLGQIAGVALYGGSMVVLYLASTLYHAAQRASLKKRLRICDHAAIYLLIAGTYTPFLIALPGRWPTWGLGTIWLLAAVGVGFKLALGFGYERLSVLMYLAIGWLGTLAIGPLVECISVRGVAWLLSGGLSYTFGMLFYLRSQSRYCHAIWHLFVLLGSALHYGAIVLYVVPLTFA